MKKSEEENSKKCCANRLANSHHSHEHGHERRTLWVVLLTAATMVAEIAFGYITNSMALLADGWHMASHVLAIGLTWITYVIVRKYGDSQKLTFSKDKLLALSGYTSAIFLLVVAILMVVASVERFVNPLTIEFDQAIYVAIIGLVVNALSAAFLHHDHSHDHNIRSAYLHVLADLLTSITAIITLLAGKYYDLYWLDSISGMISAILITKWAIGLIKGSSKDLVDFKIKEHSQ